ncbi:MAG: hypothetical protein HY650_06320 [Acidobacteria bacterium]|nr:hypothetical protein [Acidobacteriota bacterium]
MEAAEQLIEATLEASGLPGASRRAEVAEELRSHLEELVSDARREGRSADEIERLMTSRFGSPFGIGQDFSRVYRLERVVRRSLAFGLLGLVSLGAVSFFVYAIQCLVSLGLGLPPALVFAPHHWRWENELLSGLTLGYLGLFFIERLFEDRRFVKSVALVGGLFVLASLASQAWWPGHGIGLAVAFFSAVLVRFLEVHCSRGALRFAAILLFFLVLGAIAHQGATIPGARVFWLFVGPIGLAVALSCQILTSMAALFDRQILKGKFA